jgi:hypothetical protein
MVQNAFHTNGQRKRKQGERTPEGQRSQIKHKLSHGIRGISPVLLGVEKEQDWLVHYAGVRESLDPGNEFEEDLAYLIAWQLWRFGRLIRHETELTSEKVARPDLAYHNGHLSREVIQSVLTQPKAKLEEEHAAALELLTRYGAIPQCSHEVLFDPLEARPLLEAVLAHIQDNMEDTVEEGASDDDDGEEEGNSPDLNVAERTWTAAEIAEQIQILARAAGVDWREELEQVLYTKAQELHEQRCGLEEARGHVTKGLILPEKHVNRLALYERQINSVLKSTYNLLERTRAYRTGQPIPPPVSVDLTISKGSDAVGV